MIRLFLFFIGFCFCISPCCHKPPAFLQANVAIGPYG